MIEGGSCTLQWLAGSPVEQAVVDYSSGHLVVVVVVAAVLGTAHLAVAGGTGCSAVAVDTVPADPNAPFM